MIIVEDTRNQVGKHIKINNDLQKLGVKIIRSKLYVGDYSLLNNQTICIDTKKNWLEVAGNICGKQHERFRAECIRAKEAQILLIILVEEETPIELWKSPQNRLKKPLTRVSCEVLAKALKTMTEKYGVKFINCDPKDTAKNILKILEVENDNGTSNETK